MAENVHAHARPEGLPAKGDIYALIVRSVRDCGALRGAARCLTSPFLSYALPQLPRSRVAMAHNTKFDDTLYAMMQQHESEMEFLNTIFGFLQRRTACFNGPKVSASPEWAPALGEQNLVPVCRVASAALIEAVDRIDSAIGDLQPPTHDLRSPR